MITMPEGKTLQFKRDLSSPKNMLKTLVAFANTAGGRLLIGVEDRTKEVLDVENPLDEEERLCNLIADNIEPRLVPNVELIEQWGSGFRRILEEAEEQNLPEPKIEEIGMRVRFTIYLAEPMTTEVSRRVTEQVAEQVGTKSPTQLPTQLPTQSDDSVQRLLLVLKDGDKSSGALRSVLGIKHRPTFRDNYLRPALDAELIEMTIPEKPSSSKQKYRLTAKGNALLATEQQGGVK